VTDLLILPRASDYVGLWAIEPTHAAQLRQLAAPILADLSGHIAANAERVARVNAEMPGSAMELPGGQSKKLAIIDLRGTLMKSCGSMSEGTSTVRARQAIKAAAADPSISGIILRIDSPGGTVSGTADLAAEVTKARKSKPVRAFCEDLCASAAYWVASQCESISANQPTALVGSIGSLLVVSDLSKMAAKDGVEVLAFATGPLKGAGVPGTSITPEQRSYFQSLADACQVQFSAAVSSGRKLPAASLQPGAENTLATGQVWQAQQAKSLGLIDAVELWDAFVSRFAADVQASSLAAPPSCSEAEEGDDDEEDDDQDPETPKEPTRMKLSSIFALFSAKDETEAKANFDKIQSEHAAELQASAEKLTEASAKIAAIEAKHAEAIATEAEARADAIITGLCSRKMTEAEARAAAKLPAADITAKLEGKVETVPAPTPKVKTDAGEDLLTQFASITNTAERQAFYAQNAVALDTALALSK